MTRRRPRLHGDDRRGARGAAHQRSTATRRPPPATATAHGHAEGRAIPFAQPGSKTRPLLIASGKGGVGKSQRHDQPRRRPRPAGPLGRRRRRRRLRLLDPPHARRRPRPGRDRRDARAARGVGRALHLDRLLRARGPGRHLARPDAAQGARAVPHRRLLGRSRLPARSTCRPAPATSPSRLSQYLPRGEVLRRHHAAAGGPEGGPAVGGDGREGPPRRARASSRTCRGSPATTASATRSSAPAAARSWPTSWASRCSASCRCVPPLREGGDDGRPITAVDPESEAGQALPRAWPSASPSSCAPRKVFSPAAADQLTSVGCRLPLTPPSPRRSPSWMSASASPRSPRELLSSWPTTPTATRSKGADRRGPVRRTDKSCGSPTAGAARSSCRSAKIAYVEVGAADGERRIGLRELDRGGRGGADRPDRPPPALRHRQGRRRQDHDRGRAGHPCRATTGGGCSSARWTPRARWPRPSRPARCASRRGRSTTASRRWR